MLRCRVRRADGRVFTGALPAARHRGLYHLVTARASVALGGRGSRADAVAEKVLEQDAVTP
jgi:hypothetical protein